MKTQDIKNMGLAHRQVQEAEAVQVDELSKKTMGSYIKKATSDVQVANIDRGMAMSGKWTLNPKKDKIGVDAAKKGSKRQAGISKAVDKLVKTEAVGTATHKPNNGSDPEQGLSPNAKKEKARTSGVGVDANKSIDLSFKAFKAMSKTAKHNGGINPPGDKAVVKSTMAPAANQKTESVDENLSDMSKYKKAGKAKEPGVKIGKSIKGTIMKPVKAAYHGEAMDPVGQGDADIDNDGDVDKSDKYLHNRRKAISKARKGKGRVKEGAMKRMSTGDGMDTYKKKPAGEKAVMHGGKSGEKKNKEIMAVGEER